MKMKVIILLFLLLMIGLGIVGYFYFFNDNFNVIISNEIKIDPLDYLVFEIKSDDLSEHEKNKEFERFNKAKNIILNNIEQGLVLNDDRNFYAWLEVALSQEIVGDYDRAINIWKWFTDAYPYNSTSPVNLGSIYSSNVVDNIQAEKYFKIALEREKHKFHIYYNFYKLYRYNFKDEQKAIDVLKMGLENNPDSKNYVNELVDYLIVINRKKEAEEIINQWLIKHPEDYSLKIKLK